MTPGKRRGGGGYYYDGASTQATKGNQAQQAAEIISTQHAHMRTDVDCTIHAVTRLIAERTGRCTREEEGGGLTRRSAAPITKISAAGCFGV